MITIELDFGKFKTTPLKKAPETIQRSMVGALKTTGVLLKAALTAASPRDTGALANAHAFAVDEKNLSLVVFNRKAHAVFVHEGRRAGAKQPPTKALRSWVRRKLGNRGLAFIVARSIRQKGIKARPWFADTIKDKTSLVQNTLQAALDQAIAEVSK